jgi:predicted RNase H-like HicB family nuclease
LVPGNAQEVGIDTRYTKAMARKASVVIEKDEHGFYAWCPELKGCQSQGNTLEETMANIKEAIELYLETLPSDERDVVLSRQILTTTVEVNG